MRAPRLLSSVVPTQSDCVLVHAVLRANDLHTLHEFDSASRRAHRDECAVRERHPPTTNARNGRKHRATLDNRESARQDCQAIERTECAGLDELVARLLLGHQRIERIVPHSIVTLRRRNMDLLD